MTIKIDNPTLHSLLANYCGVFTKGGEDVEYMIGKLNEEFEKWNSATQKQSTCAWAEGPNVKTETHDIKPVLNLNIYSSPKFNRYTQH